MEKRIVVFDFFAGTFSVTKTCYNWNQNLIKYNSNMKISTIFALEKSLTLCKEFQKSEEFEKIKTEKVFNYMKIYCSDILLERALNIILEKYKEIVLESFQNQSTAIDGVIICGGPPCTNYSSLQGLRNSIEFQQNPELFIEKQEKSDKMVLSFLNFYLKVKHVSENLVNPFTHKKLMIHFLMENPWSVDTLRINYKNDFINKKGSQRKLNLALRKRPCLQPYLVDNGGWLYLTKHNWCAYDVENFPAKPTAIFSTMPLENKLCTHKGRHRIQTQELPNAKIRARWPKGFMEYIFLVFENLLNEKL